MALKAAQIHFAFKSELGRTAFQHIQESTSFSKKTPGFGVKGWKDFTV